MTHLEVKKNYVRNSEQNRDHHCHWPGCTKQVAPAKWGCMSHWMKLPKSLRDKIWEAFSPGQEETMTPSLEYIGVAHEIQEWIKKNDSASRGHRVDVGL